jgi:5-methylcytosine-specific restriction endonuclease McrA
MASEELIKKVWEKAKEMNGKDHDVWQNDTYSNKIRFTSYSTEGDFGWEIDHKIPNERGGSDNLRNLQPLQ